MLGSAWKPLMEVHINTNRTHACITDSINGFTGCARDKMGCRQREEKGEEVEGLPPFCVYIWSKYSIMWIPSNPGVLIFNLKTSFSVLFVSSYHNGTVTFCRNGNREKESSLTRGCISDLSAISPQSTPNRKSICGDLHVMLIGRGKTHLHFLLLSLLVPNTVLMNLNDLHLWICYHINLPPVTHHSQRSWGVSECVGMLVF